MGDMSREPSMEDILSSIRRVIARDESTMQARQARATPVADVLDLGTKSADSPIRAADDAAEEAKPAEAPKETLVSSASADAARQSLEALNAAFAAAPNLSPASRTLDDVVLEALRPMLKQWLDNNLPPIVEAMVAKEIARITGRTA